MDSVWHAMHEMTGRPVAVKLLHEGVSDDEEGRRHFMGEARASARINHPNVIDVLDAGETEEGGSSSLWGCSPASRSRRPWLPIPRSQAETFSW